MPQAKVKVYDTLSGKKKDFRPENPSKVRIYGCGPTVYGYAHVGNGRSFLTQDLVVRVLRHAGFGVSFARNYTDIDDKIINRALSEKKTSEEIATFYAKAFDENMRALEVAEPEHKPMATKTIPAIVEMIAGLEKSGMAYASGANVYYRVHKFPKYGSLSHRKVDEMVSAEPGEGKESPADFALWKAAKPNEPAWPSPWGPGRPGWHIECSAMIRDIFKDHLDIHMGGLDLIFPHHENEIAQTEGLTGKPLATYWIHGGMLEVGKEKMSKSLGNLMTISEFLEKYGAETMRMLFFQNHYRSPLEFSSEAILRSEALVDRFYQCKKLAKENAKAKIENPPPELAGLVEKMEESLLDDFNSAKALGLCLSAARVCFRENRASDWSAWAGALPLLDSVFGLVKKDPSKALAENRARRLRRAKLTPEESKEIDEKVSERNRLREQKKFSESDQIRKDLESRGLIIMDGPDGTSWTVN